PSDGSEFKVEATIKDTAGNVSDPVSDSAIMQLSAPGKPTVTIAEDTNNDGYINASELDGDIDITVALPGTANEGDTLNLDTNADGEPDQSVVLTLEDINKGNVSFQMTSPGEGEIVVEAWVTDVAGNNGEKGKDSAIIDTTVPGDENGDGTATTAPVVTIDEDTNNDGYINQDELDGDIDVTITVPVNTEVGDTLTVTNPDGSTTDYTVDQTIIDNGLTISYPPSQFPQGEETTVSAIVTDPAGNESLPGSGSATLDTTAPGAPIVTITEDANNDGFINANELDGNIDVEIKVPSDTQVDSIITVTDNAGNEQIITVTQDIIDNGTTLTFPAPAEGATIKVEATITDPAGNTGLKGNDSAKLDTSDLSADGGVGVSIVNDADDNGLLSKAELGSDNKITVEVSIPKNAVAGDKVIITGTGNGDQEVTLTQTQIDTGTIQVEFNAPNNGTTFETTAKVVDPAGNESNTATDSATISTDLPGAPTVTITEDANNDGFINANELDGDIDVEIKVPSGTQVGSTVTVTDNAGNEQIITVTQDIIDNGTTLTFPAPSEDGEIKINAIITDPAGNPSPEGSDSATLDTSNLTPGLSIEITEDANNDGFINQEEFDGVIDVKVTLSDEAVAGDTLTITASANTPQTITLTQEDIDAGYVDASFDA
ncbi:MAG: hypothetical protein VBE63_28210, partial [Lamprobacter sp.]|uniref:hypothetical protein n=1 Tax=Lamprobacter sp. TaxID=3100796 RepID=UPI002B257259